MLPKQNRLKKQKDFERVFKSGKSAKGKYFFLKALPSSKESVRIGFVVSKKVAKQAVLRNKIKRRLRAAAKERLSKTTKGYDVIIVAFPAIKSASYQEVKKDIALAIEKSII